VRSKNRVRAQSAVRAHRAPLGLRFARRATRGNTAPLLLSAPHALRARTVMRLALLRARHAYRGRPAVPVPWLAQRAWSVSILPQTLHRNATCARQGSTLPVKSPDHGIPLPVPPGASVVLLARSWMPQLCPVKLAQVASTVLQSRNHAQGVVQGDTRTVLAPHSAASVLRAQFQVLVVTSAPVAPPENTGTVRALRVSLALLGNFHRWVIPFASLVPLASSLLVTPALALYARVAGTAIPSKRIASIASKANSKHTAACLCARTVRLENSLISERRLARIARLVGTGPRAARPPHRVSIAALASSPSREAVVAPSAPAVNIRTRTHGLSATRALQARSVLTVRRHAEIAMEASTALWEQKTARDVKQASSV